MFTPAITPGLLPHLQPHLDRVAEKAARLRALGDLPEAFQRSLEHKLRIELTHGSTAIEGNTLTLRETQLLIDEGITPAGNKHLREIHETLNHDRAVICLQRFVSEGRTIDEAGIAELHRLVMANIDSERAGSYRKERVLVTGAPVQPMRPELVPDAMRELCVWITDNALSPVLAAGEAHYRFVKIHPFYDGNGRTARLLMNWISLGHGLPLTVIPAENRARYITSIDDADRGEPLAFFQLLCECVESSLDQYLTS
jgi:Fic family protein